MFGLLVRFLWPLALLQCINARVTLMPKFYGQDSAVIVDAERKVPSKLDSKLQNALYYNFPVYKLIKPGVQTTTTTTAAPVPTNSEYPSDLVEIAQTKLGLKVLPSISELGQLIGTRSNSETIEYVRSLTSNEQGIALMKDYLETLDYELSEDVPDSVDDGDDASDDDNTMDNADVEADFDERPRLETTSRSTITTKKPEMQASLLQRFGDFMKQYSLWSENTTTAAPATRKPKPSAVSFKPVFVAPPGAARMRPLLVRQPLPYHYPIPLRPVMIPAKPTQVPSTTAAPRPNKVPHLNTPKHIDVEMQSPPVATHVRQLAEMANISPQVLDRFLQQQPKLAELAKRVSTLSLSQDQTRAMDSQIFMAVKRALSQNEELKRLLESAQTLK
ncbi:uncharacterized protein LOC108159254 [Drosophila miranda]|uniref:uncharacterized protein LOC108159254 n=1 Tax=Drosophila miranda TaxID=7229 RepID=UPI0007E7F860|nr:uncharacterized protein LOC108159254 [Drosophila miranda]